MEIDVARYIQCVDCAYMEVVMARKRHPDMFCRGLAPPKGVLCKRGENVFGFHLSTLYSILKSYRLPDASRATLIGLTMFVLAETLMLMPRRCNSARETEFSYNYHIYYHLSRTRST